MENSQPEVELVKFGWNSPEYRKKQRERYWKARFPENWQQKMNESLERKRLDKKKKQERQEERTRQLTEQLNDSRRRENERKKEEAHQRKLLGLKKQDRPVLLDKPLTRLELMSAISARLIQPTVDDMNFTRLVQLLATLKGWDRVEKKPESKPEPEQPAPQETNELKLILQAEEHKRKTNGTK